MVVPEDKAGRHMLRPHQAIVVLHYGCIVLLPKQPCVVHLRLIVQIHAQVFLRNYRYKNDQYATGDSSFSAAARADLVLMILVGLMQIGTK